MILGGSLPAAIAGATVVGISQKLKNDADEIEKTAAELRLAFEEFNSMVIGTTQLHDVVKNIEKFLETVGHHARQMQRTGMTTGSETRAKVTLIQFQNQATQVISACDKFSDAQKDVELTLLTLGRKYGGEKALIEQWEKEIENGIQNLLIGG